MSDALRSAILAAAEAVTAARQELGRLDGAAGDGDHGMTMSIGARNVRKKLDAVPADASPADLLRLVSLAMGDVGGAIGPLYSAALAAVAAEVESAGATDAGDVLDALGAWDVALLHRAAEAAERAIVRLGHAAPGDKTVVDALHPVVESLASTDTAGPRQLGAAIAAAADAAEAGAATTADMVARVGRASRLGERSRGLPDAGATSFAIIIRAVADAYLRGRSDAGTDGA